MRPHTDSSLGHCSYLNTCYSEPSYALSPSIPPTPSRFPGFHGQQGRFPQPNAGRGPSSLPSGLGAGGRGKDKAPCRYLHFEVDWNEPDEASTTGILTAKKSMFASSIGRGPTINTKSVSLRHSIYEQISQQSVSPSMDQLRCPRV